MYSRIFKYLKSQSFFILGPRGVGKTSWVQQEFQNEPYIDLLDAEKFNILQAHPSKLASFLPSKFNWIIIDEIQLLPELLNEVHRLIENKKYKFVLTGSSARKLKQKGVNLLAGRALTFFFFPLTVKELGDDFNFEF